MFIAYSVVNALALLLLFFRVPRRAALGVGLYWPPPAARTPQPRWNKASWCAPRAYGPPPRRRCRVSCAIEVPRRVDGQSAVGSDRASSTLPRLLGCDASACGKGEGAFGDLFGNGAEFELVVPCVVPEDGE